MLEALIGAQVRDWVQSHPIEDTLAWIRQYIIPECDAPMLVQLLNLIIQEVGLPEWLNQGSAEDLAYILSVTDTVTLLKLQAALNDAHRRKSGAWSLKS